MTAIAWTLVLLRCNPTRGEESRSFFYQCEPSQEFRSVHQFTSQSPFFALNPRRPFWGGGATDLWPGTSLNNLLRTWRKSAWGGGGDKRPLSRGSDPATCREQTRSLELDPLFCENRHEADHLHHCQVCSLEDNLVLVNCNTKEINGEFNFLDANLSVRVLERICDATCLTEPL